MKIALITGITGQDVKSLGWDSKIGLQEGIEKTFKWYKENACK
jgi:dTDP-D-glucose 4,6-dehydratase